MPGSLKRAIFFGFLIFFCYWIISLTSDYAAESDQKSPKLSDDSARYAKKLSRRIFPLEKGKAFSVRLAKSPEPKLVSRDFQDQDEVENLSGPETATMTYNVKISVEEASSVMRVASGVQRSKLHVIEVSRNMTDCQDACPAMAKCPGREQSTGFSSCQNGHFRDSEDTVVNSPTYQQGGETFTAWLGYPSFDGDHFAIQEVHLTSSGEMHNQASFFNAGGCQEYLPRTDEMLAPGRVVAVYESGILLHSEDTSYGHLIGELLPAFFQMRDYIRANPETPVLFNRGSQFSMLAYLLGINDLRVIHLDNKPAYMENLIQPQRLPCDFAPHAVWQQFRAFFFREMLPQILDGEVSRKATKLKIVVIENGLAPEWVASLVNQLENNYGGAGEVVTHRQEDDAHVMLTLDTFTSASLVVGAHGDALVNMVFMPDNAVVLELISETDGSLVFGLLASAVELTYDFLIAPVSAQVVFEKVKELADGFKHGV